MNATAQRRWKGRGETTHQCYYPAPKRIEAKEDNAHQDCVQTFNGPHKFLSNFFWSELEFEGARYPSVEHAFQAAKLTTNADRVAWGFTDDKLSFGAAKRLGRQVQLRADWREVREDVMAACLKSKFSSSDLRTKLLATGTRELIDGHSGSPDLVWGYHFPSQAGENRLGLLLMMLRAELREGNLVSQTLPKAAALTATVGAPTQATAAFYALDWPVKCLHDGLPEAYARTIKRFALEEGVCGSILLLPRRKICIALQGTGQQVDNWERRMRTESVDVNSRGRPCRERMLVELLRTPLRGVLATGVDFRIAEVASWQVLVLDSACALGIGEKELAEALGPEVPELPSNVRYAPGRTAVFLDGKRYPLCLNDDKASVVDAPLLGCPSDQTPRGTGTPVPLSCEGRKPSIFGGKFARTVEGLLGEAECCALIELAEAQGFGLAGSRGFNPFARFALRSLVDAPEVAAAITARLAALLPSEYPPGSGRPLVGVNERLRFLKYLPGMHHSGDHTDCAHDDPTRGRSFLTVQLYLNSDFSGGRTTFVSDRLIPIEPAAGSAVVFDHELYHRGGVVTAGTKFAMRLDVLYGFPGGPSTADASQAAAPDVEAAHSSKGRGGRGSRWGRR